jgi:hypothetical protein
MVERQETEYIPLMQIDAVYNDEDTLRLLDKALIGYGFSPEQALSHTKHLMAHKGVDPGTGLIYVERLPDGELDTSYQPVGSRTDEQIITIAEAAGKPSECDQLIIHEAQKEFPLESND